MRWHVPRSLVIDAVICRICCQRPWRVEGQESVMDMGFTFRAWCHGAYRRWVVGAELVHLAAYRDDPGLLRRALTAFEAMRTALPPILVTIRRLRGRRMPPAPRDRLTVWVVS